MHFRTGNHPGLPSSSLDYLLMLDKEEGSALGISANLNFGREFVVVAEVNRVVIAVFSSPLATQALRMDRKQERFLADPHVRIIDRGFHRIHREIRWQVASLHLNSQDARGFRVHPYRAAVSRYQTLRAYRQPPV